jgi:hypothetical protein
LAVDIRKGEAPIFKVKTLEGSGDSALFVARPIPAAKD